MEEAINEMDLIQADSYTLLESSTLKLLEWLRKNGWKSYDPQDFKGLPIIKDLVIGTSTPARFLKYLIYFSTALFPITSRKILRIKPTVPAEAVGDLATGYIDFSSVTEDKRYADEAIRCLEWLKANHITGYNGYCWGLPFDWRSITVVPKGTPLSHTTAVCARSFIDYYQFAGDSSYIDVAWQSCCHIKKDLNLKKQPRDAISFSYSPRDDMEVINTNADIAALFARVASITQDRELAEISRRVGLFVVNEQLPDGSWPYFSYKYRSRGLIIDNHHTAMTLSALSDLLLYEGDPELIRKYSRAFKKGLKFYLARFFDANGFPYATPRHRYPAAVISCGEGISLLAKSGILQPSVSFNLSIDSILSKLISWTIKNMQGEDGGFYYRRYPLLKIRLRHIRGQGLMLRALGKALKYVTAVLEDGQG